MINRTIEPYGGRTEECASHGCKMPADFRFESGGVGSYYCAGCALRLHCTYEDRDTRTWPSWQKPMGLHMGGEPNPFHDPDVSGYLDQKSERIEQLEVVIRAALSFIQDRHRSPEDGHAVMVTAALRGALRDGRRHD